MSFWFTDQHTEHVQFAMATQNQLYHGTSKYQTIDIFETKAFGRALVLDGDLMLTERDEFIYHDMIVHVPMAVNPSIKRVLVIGGGDGGTVRELARYETIEAIDLVEIDEEVVRLSQEYLPFTAHALEDSRVTLYFEDGVVYLANIKQRYDLIIVDSTDPMGPGEGLFSKAFYENCHTALTERGILINQHESPFYEEDAREMQRSHEKLKRTFDVAKVYQFHMPTYPSGHWLFGFASKGLDPEQFDEKAWESLGLSTRYYNTNIHKGAFALPTYVVQMLENV